MFFELVFIAYTNTIFCNFLFLIGKIFHCIKKVKYLQCNNKNQYVHNEDRWVTAMFYPVSCIRLTLNLFIVTARRSKV